MVRQHTWHNVWNSTLWAICLNYLSYLIVRKRHCVSAAGSMNLHNHKEKLLGLGRYLCDCQRCPSITISYYRGKHMKMCVRRSHYLGLWHLSVAAVWCINPTTWSSGATDDLVFVRNRRKSSLGSRNSFLLNRWHLNELKTNNLICV